MVLVVVFFATQVIPSYGWDMASDFLCEVGLRFYRVARYSDALSEFQKALLVNPNNETARVYMQLLREKGSIPAEIGYAAAVSPLPAARVFEKPAELPLLGEKRSRSAVATEEKAEFIPVRERAWSRPEAGPSVARSKAISESLLLSQKVLEKGREKKKEKVEKGLLKAERAAAAKKPSKEAEVSRLLASLQAKPAPSTGPQPQKAQAEVEEKGLPLEKKVALPQAIAAAEKTLKPAEAAVPAPVTAAAGKKEPPVAVLKIADAAAQKEPVRIELGRQLILRGTDMRRFLAVAEDVLLVKRLSATELSVEGKKLGPTYLHVWEGDERRTLSLLIVPPAPSGPTVDQEAETYAEKAKNFKLRYFVDWSAFMTGRRLGSVEKQGRDIWDHSLYLQGQTPYGKLNSALSVSSIGKSTDLTYVTLGLNEGEFLSLKDFSLHVFDFTHGISNLALAGGNLRGVLFMTPVAERKFDYTVFWGREGGGRYAGLSPGLQKVKDSFLSGLNANLYPAKGQKYHATVYRGWGPDRAASVGDGGYDLGGAFQFKPWGVGYEVASDLERYAYLLNSTYMGQKLFLKSELRQMHKEFKSSGGQGSRAGELGLLSTVSYNPAEAVSVSSRLDVFKDGLFPAPDDKDFWNEDFSVNTAVKVSPLTRMSVDYGFQNLIGRISPSRSYTSGIGFSQGIEWVKRWDVYTTYRYGINRHFASPGSDYKSHKILSGVSVDLFKNLDYFLSTEQSWVDALSLDDSARPWSYETGVLWSDRIFGSSFHGNARLIFHNEENAQSAFSFLSGEDYLEGYAEISFRPNPDFEAFFNTRVRNVWAENPDAKKRVDVNLYGGLRYVWDTGLRWETYGSLDGHVFNDLNLDGTRQKEEPPVAGVKVRADKDRVQVSNKEGYFRFPKVRTGEVKVTLDSATIPTGYVPTSVGLLTVTVSRAKKERVAFGVGVRTEIRGSVFEETTDGRTQGLKGVVLTLEDGTQAATDDYGRYAFTKVTPGKHKIALGLPTLPGIYIPKVPIYKEVDVSEGASVVHNFPVKRKEK